MKNLTVDSANQVHSLLKNIFPRKIKKELKNVNKRERIYTSERVVKGMIFQALNPLNSCRDGLIFVLNECKKVASLNTGAYCRAKKKIPVELLKKLALYLGNKNSIIKKNSKRFLWIDGTTFRLFDSKENQKKYPQTDTQKEELGFPIIRALCAVCAYSGSIVDVELSKYSGQGTGEPSLLRRMLSRFNKGDVLVMDRFFCDPFLLNRVFNLKMDFIVRGRDSKIIKIFKAFNIKGNDGIVDLKRPIRTTQHEGDLVFKKIKIRVIKTIINKPGFRSKELFIMTSLFTMAKEEIEELYQNRWGIELAYRDLKISLGLQFIRSKTPDSVEKEIWSTVIAFNIIRKIMTISSRFFNRKKYKFSFKTTISLVLYNKIKLTMNDFFKYVSRCYFISRSRSEIRAIKRRRNRYPLLTLPRKLANLEILGIEEEKGAISA